LWVLKKRSFSRDEIRDEGCTIKSLSMELFNRLSSESRDRKDEWWQDRETETEGGGSESDRKSKCEKREEKGIRRWLEW
jgi:hypothetical protein